MSNVIELHSDHHENTGEAQDGVLQFYAELVQVGRFHVGLGEVVGTNDDRVGVCGPVVGPGRGNGALYLTIAEAAELGELLQGIAREYEA